MKVFSHHFSEKVDWWNTLSNKHLNNLQTGKVICLQRPAFIECIFSFSVNRWNWIKCINTTILIHIIYEFIHLFKVSISQALVSFILHSFTCRSSAPDTINDKLGWKAAQITPWSWPSKTYLTTASLPPKRSVSICVNLCVNCVLVRCLSIPAKSFQLKPR